MKVRMLKVVLSVKQKKRRPKVTKDNVLVTELLPTRYVVLNTHISDMLII